MYTIYDTIMEWTSCRVAILTDYSGQSCPDCGIYEYVGEPIYLTLSAVGMYAGKSLATMGKVGYPSTCEYFYVVLKRI